MSFDVEKSCSGTDHFVHGPAGFVAEHEAEAWPGCAPGWYAHRGQDGADGIDGPFPDRAAAERALLGREPSGTAQPISKQGFAAAIAETFDDDLGLGAVNPSDLPEDVVDCAWADFRRRLAQGHDADDSCREAALAVAWMPPQGLVDLNRARQAAPFEGPSGRADA